MENARSAVLKSLQHVFSKDGYSNLVAASEIGKTSLSPQDKAFAYALFYGTIERKITLDYFISKHFTGNWEKLSQNVLNALRIGAFQIVYMDKVPSSAAVNESVELIRRSKDNKAAGLVNAVLRAIAQSKPEESLPGGRNVKALSLRFSCEKSIVKSLMTDYGADFAEGILQHSFNFPAVTVRVNTLKITADALLKQFKSAGINAQPHEALKNAVNLFSSGDITKLPEFKSGLFHVQDAASQICCEALAPQKGQRVLDCCAAPGGKSFTLSQLMGGIGEVVSLDLYPQRTVLVEESAKRLGIGCINTGVHDAEVYEHNLGLFDKILCDVPCSGLGIMRKKPEIRYKLVTNLDNLCDLQYRILCTSGRYLKKDGTLIYSTCTLRRSENETVVERFLAEHRDFEMFTPEEHTYKKYHADAGSHNLTLFPHIHNTDGFFICALRKK